MEQYTDDERVEDIKKWWKENGASIIAGIALGVAAIFGWQYWNSYRNTQAEQASQAYDAFVKVVEKPDAEQARQRGQALLTDFPKSSYATLAALWLAKLASDGGDATTAIKQLEWVIENTRLDEFKDIARLRLARLLLATGRSSDAEQQLARVMTASLAAEREELRGDLALAGNDPARARTAYAAALAASRDDLLLQYKLDNLAPPSADSVIMAPAAPPAPAQSESTQPQSTTPPPEASMPQTAAPATPAATPPVVAEPAAASSVGAASAPAAAETAPAPIPPVPTPGQ